MTIIKKTVQEIGCGTRSAALLHGYPESKGQIAILQQERASVLQL
jgi:hypothetical protein